CRSAGSTARGGPPTPAAIDSQRPAGAGARPAAAPRPRVVSLFTRAAGNCLSIHLKTGSGLAANPCLATRRPDPSNTPMKVRVGLIMGSKSDWETLQHAAATLEQLRIPFESRVVSAHRTPDLLFEYAASARDRGLEVIIAGAGGAAHLPGMVAAKTSLPV